MPHYLGAVREPVGPAIDNLNRLEKLGLHSADLWMTLRDMRYQMVHEYILDLQQLTNALNHAHENVAILIDDSQKNIADLASRNWI